MIDGSRWEDVGSFPNVKNGVLGFSIHPGLMHSLCNQCYLAMESQRVHLFLELSQDRSTNSSRENENGTRETW